MHSCRQRRIRNWSKVHSLGTYTESVLLVLELLAGVILLYTKSTLIQFLKAYIYLFAPVSCFHNRKKYGRVNYNFFYFPWVSYEFCCPELALTLCFRICHSHFVGFVSELIFLKLSHKSFSLAWLLTRKRKWNKLSKCKTKNKTNRFSQSKQKTPTVLIETPLQTELELCSNWVSFVLLQCFLNFSLGVGTWHVLGDKGGYATSATVMVPW